MRFVAPQEHEAEERAWAVVSAAYAEREPVAWPRRHWQPLVAAAVVAAVVAAALSQPGRSVVHSFRKAVGIETAEPVLFSLPTRGELLVNSRSGLWLVRPDGSKRRLGRYRDATFSPHGLFVAATRANQLVAFDPKAHVRWELARPAPRFPAWTGTRMDTRIAYLSRGRLRIVAGDGTGDRLVGPAALIPPTWLPGRKLVYFDGHRWMVYNVTSGSARRTTPPREAATIRRRAGQSEVVTGGRVVFRGTGIFDSVALSPDGRWLLVSWPTANQWVFIRPQPRKIVGVSRITQQFGRDARVEDWCCAAP